MYSCSVLLSKTSLKKKTPTSDTIIIIIIKIRIAMCEFVVKANGNDLPFVHENKF